MQEPGLGDVHDAAVDDHAGVEQDAGIHRVGFDQAADAARAEDEGHHLVAPVEPQGHAPVSEHQGHDQGDHEPQVPRQLGQEQADERRQQQPDQESHRRRYQIWQRRHIQLIFEPEERLGRNVREPKEAEEGARQCRQQQDDRSQRVTRDGSFRNDESGVLDARYKSKQQAQEPEDAFHAHCDHLLFPGWETQARGVAQTRAPSCPN